MEGAWEKIRTFADRPVSAVNTKQSEEGPGSFRVKGA
jgi:hypothetical protein